MLHPSLSPPADHGVLPSTSDSLAAASHFHAPQAMWAPGRVAVQGPLLVMKGTPL